MIMLIDDFNCKPDTKLSEELKSYPEIKFDIEDSSSFTQMSFIKVSLVNKSGSMGSSMGSPIGSSIDLTPRQNEILEIIKLNTKVSYRAIAEQLKINDSAVKKHLNNLKEKGVLRRVGGTRGYWEILDENH